MTQTPDTQQDLILTFVRGSWEMRPYPIPGRDQWEDYEEFLRDGGFRKFTGLGASLSLTIYCCDQGHNDLPEHAPRFLIDIDNADFVFSIAAVDIADLMDLLTRWGPALTAVILNGLWQSLDYYEASRFDFKHNRVAGAAALVAEGLSRRQGWHDELMSIQKARQKRHASASAKHEGSEAESRADST